MGKLNLQSIDKQPSDNFVFCGKLVILAVYFSGIISKLGYADLPLISIFEHNLPSSTYFIIWQILFAASSLAVFLNWKTREFLLTNGLLLILAILMNELCYSNNLVFAACLLITFSVSNRFYNWVPIQLSIVYFGAFIDKLWFEQWRNGDFMTAYFPHNRILVHLQPIFSYHFSIMAMTYSTLVIELLLAILILIPKIRKYCLLLGLCFHFSTIVFMHNFFGIYIVAILISYLSLINTTINLNQELSLSRLTDYIKSVSAGLKDKKKKEMWYQFNLNHHTFRNYKAVFISIISNPYLYAILTIFLTFNYIYINILLLFVIIVIAVIFAIQIELRERKTRNA